MEGSVNRRGGVSNAAGKEGDAAQHPVLALLRWVDHDDISLVNGWVAEATKKLKNGSSPAQVVEAFQRTHRAQSVDPAAFQIRPNMFVFSGGDTQSGKTKLGMLTVISAALGAARLLSIYLVQNSNEAKRRFASSVRGLNTLINELCLLANIRRVPRLELFDSDSVPLWMLSASAFLNGTSDVIPIFYAISNQNKLAKIKQVVLRHVAKTTKLRDAKGRLPLLGLFDESDVNYKGGASALEREAAKKIDFSGADKWACFEDAMSTVVHITATPAAVAINRDMQDGRKVVCIKSSPSENYCGFDRTGLGQKEITRMYLVEGTMEEEIYQMTDHVANSEEDRAALIITSEKSKIADREAMASHLAKKYATSGVAVTSWSRDRVTVNTTVPEFTTCLGELGEDAPEKDIGDGVSEFRITKTPYNSYRMTITLLAKAAEEALNLVLKFILLGNQMVDRGVNVKDIQHGNALTDILVLAPSHWYNDKLMQLFGRATGNSKRVYPVRAWARKKVHDAHIEANATDRWINQDLFGNGVSVLDAFRDAGDKLRAAAPGAEVEDTHGVLTMVTSRMTRPKANKRAVAEKDACAAAAKKGRNTFSAYTFKSAAEARPVKEEEAAAAPAAPAAVPAAWAAPAAASAAAVAPAAAAEKGAAATATSLPLGSPDFLEAFGRGSGEAAASLPLLPLGSPDFLEAFGQELGEEEEQQRQQQRQRARMAEPELAMKELMENYRDVLAGLIAEQVAERTAEGAPGLGVQGMAEAIAGQAGYPSTDEKTLPVAVVRYMVENEYPALFKAKVFFFKNNGTGTFVAAV